MKEIINGKSIGSFTIRDSILKHIQTFSKYDLQPKENADIYIKSGLFKLVFKGNPRILTHICITDDPSYKFLDKICIGSTMGEVEKLAGSYHDELDTFLLKKYPGIAFDVGSRNDWPDDYWDEKEAPIVAICVFDPNYKEEKK